MNELKLEVMNNNIELFGIENLNKANIRDDNRREKYIKSFKNIIPELGSLSLNQKLFLIESFNTLEKIVKSLKPFNDMKISYSLSLAGGAVRDFLIDKVDGINDLDIYLFLGDKKIHDISKVSNAKNLLSMNQQQYEYIINNSDYSKVNFNNGQDYLDNALMGILSNDFKINNTYYEKNISRIYLEEAIKTIFKIANKNIPNNDLTFLKNIDLMVTQSPISDFINFFDFEICKTYIDFRPNTFLDVDAELKAEHKFNKEIENLSDEDKIKYMYSHLMVKQSCLQDLENKTLTLNLNKFPKEHIDYFLEKHYLKLVDKFPDHEFKTQNEILLNKPENIEVIKKAQNLRLDRLLSKNSEIKAKKNKI